jgi:hypothetical protein
VLIVTDELLFRAKAVEAERAAAAASKLASLQDEYAHAWADEAPAIEIGMHLEIYIIRRRKGEDGSPFEFKI